MKVLRRKGDNAYSLLNLVTQSVTDYHVSKMHPFRHDERTSTPIQVACTDSFDEYVVENIVQMRGSFKKDSSKRNLRFFVKWAGYHDCENTWEKWNLLCKTDALQIFIKNHKSPYAYKYEMKNWIHPNDSDNDADP